MRPLAFYVVVAVVTCMSLWRCVAANCPTNGNAHAVYITSNMGDNIWSFDSQGSYLGEVINRDSFPKDVRVDKLRAMRFGPEGHLYVSSARGSYSRVFAISGNGIVNGTLRANCARDYLFTATTQSSKNPFLDHPYDILFHPETMDLYVSNQNSVTITRYLYRPEKARFPSWEAATNVKTAMPSGNTGSFWRRQREIRAMENSVGGNVASGRVFGNGYAGNSTDAPEIDMPHRIPENAGLLASGWSGSYYLNSVRGIALSPKLPRALVDGITPPGLFTVDNMTAMAYYLLVCDVAASVVHVFDPETGERLFGLWVPSPVQVMFPARFYRSEVVTRTATGASVVRVEQPYIFVTSKEDAVTYMVHFSSRSSAAVPGHTQNSIFRDDAYSVEPHRMVLITKPVPLHAGSGLYENPSRDVVLVADRNGRRVSSYASPFASGASEPAWDAGRSVFLGFFVKRLPDQPEFVLSVALESQGNIPFCYELGADGTLRYVALCTAVHIWSTVLLVVLVVVPTMLLYRQGKHCLRERRRRERLREARQQELENEVATPVLTTAQAIARSANAEQSPLLGVSTSSRRTYGTS